MRIALFLAVLILLEIYSFQAIKTATKLKWVYYLYFGISLLILANFFLRFLGSNQATVLKGAHAYALGFLLALVSAQVILVLFLLGEDIVRFVVGLFSKSKTTGKGFYMPSRRSFIAKVGLAVSAIPFTSLLYGMYKGKYNFKVLRYDLEFDDLPEEFDGYQITQISDVHCGSFDNKKKITYGVDLIKEQKSDVVFFTGDLVNNVAEELDDWKSLFGSISAPDGVYSVLGNHDYGDYFRWDNAGEKEQNFEDFKNSQQEMGWNLLLNEQHEIKRKDSKIHIVGVENWGTGNFSKYGDLNKASKGLSKKDFKILLSHDPSHWREKVQSDDKNYQLTLSGHTHGMQFGIDIPGVVKWSPVKYRYKYWAGVYEKYGRYINVNRGFGYLAYPGRVGMWPEITVIRLKKKKTTN